MSLNSISTRQNLQAKPTFGNDFNLQDMPWKADFQAAPVIDPSETNKNPGAKINALFGCAYKSVKNKFERVINGQSILDLENARKIVVDGNLIVAFPGTKGIPEQQVNVHYLFAKHLTWEPSRGTIMWMTGMGSNARVDYEIIERLARDGFDVMAIDPLGSGESGWLKNSEGDALRYEDLTHPLDGANVWVPLTQVYTRALNQLNKSLGDNQLVYLAGHSLGAFTVHTMASETSPIQVNNLQGVISFCGYVSDGETYKPDSYIKFMASAPNFYAMKAMPQGLATFIQVEGTKAVVGSFASDSVTRAQRQSIAMATAWPYVEADVSRDEQAASAEALHFYGQMIWNSLQDEVAARNVAVMQKNIRVPVLTYYSDADNIHPSVDFVHAPNSAINDNFKRYDIAAVGGQSGWGHMFPQEQGALVSRLIAEGAQATIKQ